MKRVLAFAAAALACSSASKYKAPTPLATIALPTGDKLKPYDPAKPGLARPFGMADFNGKAWIALGNLDSGFSPSGPGFLAAIVPSTGATTLVDLGGSDGQKCKDPVFVRAAAGKLYVAC